MKSMSRAVAAKVPHLHVMCTGEVVSILGREMVKGRVMVNLLVVNGFTRTDPDTEEVTVLDDGAVYRLTEREFELNRRHV